MCVAKQVPKNEATPFADVSVLAAGDFYQLKPVPGKALFDKNSVKELSDLAPTLWDSFQLDELQKSMRQ